MRRNKKRLFWAIILLLLFLPPCYYLKSSFVGRKAQLERERLLVRKQISKPLQPTKRERVDIGPYLDLEELTLVSPETEEISIPRPAAEEAREARRKDLEAKIRKLEQELLAKDGKIEDWKRRWEEKRRELERYKRELMALRKETARKRKSLVQRPPMKKEEERAEPEIREKRVASPLATAALEECEGVPISHRNLALFLSKGLQLGSNLSYDQAVVALHGLGISPMGGWSRGDPSFPIGADELEEILWRVKRATSAGLVAPEYRELTGGLRHYCRREKAQLVGAPQCEGPMVTECGGCEISQCDFAIYVCKVLGIGEALNCEQSFLALAALQISPKRGWRADNPYALINQREMEEVRCSVREAYEKGLIETDETIVVASVNDYCLWLKMNIGVVGEGTVAEATALSDYQGGDRISIPKGGTVASASE
jgi:hypothetical protein